MVASLDTDARPRADRHALTVVLTVIAGTVMIPLDVTVVAVALTLWALKQEREVSLSVCLTLALAALLWAFTDPQAIALGISSSLLWAFAAGAYVASLRSGEELEGVTA